MNERVNTGLYILALHDALPFFCFFFFNDTATTEIYTLSLHDALPICPTDEMMMAPTAIVPQHSLRKITLNLEKIEPLLHDTLTRSATGTIES